MSANNTEPNNTEQTADEMMARLDDINRDGHFDAFGAFAAFDAWGWDVVRILSFHIFPPFTPTLKKIIKGQGVHLCTFSGHHPIRRATRQKKVGPSTQSEQDHFGPAQHPIVVAPQRAGRVDERVDGRIDSARSGPYTRSPAVL